MNECSEDLKALKELKEKTQNKGELRRLNAIEKKLKAYETLLDVLWYPYLYNTGRGSKDLYLVCPVPCGDYEEFPITRKDFKILMRAGIKERQDKE